MGKYFCFFFVFAIFLASCDDSYDSHETETDVAVFKNAQNDGWIFPAGTSAKDIFRCLGEGEHSLPGSLTLSDKDALTDFGYKAEQTRQTSGIRITVSKENGRPDLVTVSVLFSYSNAMSPDFNYEKECLPEKLCVYRYQEMYRASENLWVMRNDKIPFKMEL